MKANDIDGRIYTLRFMLIVGMVNPAINDDEKGTR